MNTRHLESVRWQRFARQLAAWGLPLLVTLLALALHLYQLEGKSLWNDELGTLTVAGWHDGWPAALRNSLTVPTLPKPPAYFILIHLFLTWGESVFAARLPSVLFATLTVPLVYVLGKALFDRWTGLLAAFLLAIAPLHLRYAQEARMYAMLAFLSILSLYLFWRAIRSTRFRWWLAFALVAGLNLYTLQCALLPLGVMVLLALWLLVHPPARSQFPFRARHFLATMILLLLLYLPLVPSLIEGLLSEKGLGGTATPVYGELHWNVDSLLGALRLFSGGNSLGLVVYAGLFLLALGILLVTQSETVRSLIRRRGTAAAAAPPPDPDRAGRRRSTRCAVLLLLAWLVLPPAILLSLPVGHGVRIRYLIYLLPAYLILVAYTPGCILRWLAAWPGPLSRPALTRRVRGVAAALVLLAVLAAINAPALAAYYDESKQNWRDATAMVLAAATPGEPLFVSRQNHQTGVLFYAQALDPAADTLTEDNVCLLPKEPGQDLLPADQEQGWLIVPLREEYLPGGELDAKLKPYYQLSEPVVLAPSQVAQDSALIGPISYRSLAVIQIQRLHPPSIHFRAEDGTLAPGSCTWLRWDVENVREVYLDGQGVVGHDEQQVCPATSTRYQLEVIDTGGATIVEVVEIAVLSP